MNFASLLRMHENRQTNNYFGNQYTINCNRKNDTPIGYGGQNYSGMKKRVIEPVEPINQSLTEIFANFEENPHVQWILQLQCHKVKIHKFKPSKFKSKKEEPQHIQKFQPRLYPQQRHNPINQNTNEDNPSDFIQHDYPAQERKNYSPLHRMKPKRLDQDQNWMQNLNQNKFSFGEESDQITLQQNLHEIPSENVQNQTNIENQSQLNVQNQSCIEERHQYEVQQGNYTVRGVNLMNKCGKLQNGLKISQNNNQKDQIKQINSVDKIESDKNIQQKVIPENGVQYSPNIGFSFEEVGKMDHNQQKLKIDQFTKQKDSHQQQIENQLKQNLPTDKAQNSISKGQKQQSTSIKLVQPQNQPTKQTSLTIIKTDVEIKENQKKSSENDSVVIPQDGNSNDTKEKQSSPHRIYYKANVRTLTPQKFKYPRVQSKIQTNTDIQPFSTENDATKINSQANIKKPLEAQSQNAENEKVIVISNSERLLALINESKKLLQSRTINEEKKNEDRISRIVLHQPPSETTITLKELSEPSKENEQVKLQSKKNEKKMEEKQSEQKIPKIDITPKALTATLQEIKIMPTQRLTPPKKEQSTPIASSPRSPLQQKQKIFNQLANIQTNYASEKPNLSPSIKNTQNMVTQKQISQFVPPPMNVQPNITKNTEVSQKSYQNANYTYKPLNMPPLPKQLEQKDNSVYKPPVYQTYVTPSQPTTQVFQPTVQPYQQITDPSLGIQKVPVQPHMNVNFNPPKIKTYSPYFTISNPNTVKPSGVTSAQQNITNQIYQTFTYSGFPNPQQNSSMRPLTPNQPNAYFKISNTNYVTPLEKQEKTQQKEIYQIRVNQNVSQKENIKPVGLDISGVKCVESKIYDPIISNLQSDPKESSIEFSLRIDQHFHIGTK